MSETRDKAVIRYLRYQGILPGTEIMDGPIAKAFMAGWGEALASIERTGDRMSDPIAANTASSREAAWRVLEKLANEEWMRVTIRKSDGSGFQLIVPAAMGSTQWNDLLSAFKIGIWKESCFVERDTGPNHVKELLQEALAVLKDGSR